MELIQVLIALFLGSIGSVALAGVMFFLSDEKLNKVSTYLMYLAGGTLLGAAFLGMIPKALTLEGPEIIFPSILGGILFFFVLEKIILWRSCRNKNCERHMNAAAPIILIGDAFHNAIDGVVIAASFLTSTEMGVFVTLSVILHEIPQELGDFGILIKSGFSRSKAFWFKRSLSNGIRSYSLFYPRQNSGTDSACTRIFSSKFPLYFAGRSDSRNAS
jgi:zinc and cadmium transporter